MQVLRTSRRVQNGIGIGILERPGSCLDITSRSKDQLFTKKGSKSLSQVPVCLV